MVHHGPRPAGEAKGRRRSSVAEQEVADRTSGAAARVQRYRTGLANAVATPRRAVRRLRARGRSTATGTPELGASPEDQVPASPTDLADADVAVQRAWRSVRLVIAIIVTVAPIVAALISWRIRVARARHGGQPIDL
jgi:hypothetical protein